MNDTMVEFSAFYRSLIRKDNIIYMFFTTGMLFWAVKAITFIPTKVNLVLICAGMDESEITWINKKLKYPTFFIDNYWNDKQVHQMLFQVNQNNYGWIDCDCFVLNPTIFDEMTVLDEHTSINVCWASRDKKSGHLLLNTYLLFINIKSIHDMNNLSLNTSPGLYIYPQDMSSNRIYPAEPNIIQSNHLPYIQEFNGTYPRQFSPDKDDGFFDTLLLFQFVAEGLGYDIKRIRMMCHDNYMSDELLHVGGSSSSSRMGKEADNIIQKYQFDSRIFHMVSYLLLTELAPELPEMYKKKQMIYRKLYDIDNKSIRIIRSEIASLFRKNNLSEGTIDKIFHEDGK